MQWKHSAKLFSHILFISAGIPPLKPLFKLSHDLSPTFCSNFVCIPHQFVTLRNLTPSPKSQSSYLSPFQGPTSVNRTHTQKNFIPVELKTIFVCNKDISSADFAVIFMKGNLSSQREEKVEK